MILREKVSHDMFALEIELSSDHSLFPMQDDFGN